ncbi:MAG: hypothetical protein K0Q56_1388 [Sporolactobacillus laevolacticus]|nr:hypothetical protein [Sporolactobacillus laevolacticus]
MKHQRLADLSLLFVAIVWGSSYLDTKVVLQDLSVFSFLFIRFAITVLVMLVFTWKILLRSSKQTWLSGIIFGLFLSAIFINETWGIKYTSAANSGFLISLFVVFTPLFEAVILKKKLRLGILAAVMISVIGTSLLSLKEGYHFNIGDLLILCAAALRGMQMTLTQKLSHAEMDSRALTTIQLSVVAIIMGMLSLFFRPSNESMLPADLNFWLLTIYLSLFGTLLAFYIQLVMIRRTSPTRVGLLMGTEPVFSTIFAVFIGGEHLTWQGWLGGILIILATYYGRYAESKHSQHSNEMVLEDQG